VLKVFRGYATKWRKVIGFSNFKLKNAMAALFALSFERQLLAAQTGQMLSLICATMATRNSAGCRHDRRLFKILCLMDTPEADNPGHFR
jgi:hypothetical protein